MAKINKALWMALGSGACVATAFGGLLAGVQGEHPLIAFAVFMLSNIVAAFAADRARSLADDGLADELMFERERQACLDVVRSQGL